MSRGRPSTSSSAWSGPTAGEPGVAQVLALAGERRTFAELADPGRGARWPRPWPCSTPPPWSPATRPSASMWARRCSSPPTPPSFADRLRALGSTAEVLEHVAPVVERSRRRRSPRPWRWPPTTPWSRWCPGRDQSRHAHLCEMTRGLLPQIPRLFGDGPALDHRDGVQCPGWTSCLYAISLGGLRADATGADAGTGAGPRGARAGGQPEQRRRPSHRTDTEPEGTGRRARAAETGPARRPSPGGRAHGTAAGHYRGARRSGIGGRAGAAPTG